MKKLFTLIVILMIAGLLNNTSAQTCVPDHTGYTSVPDSGKLLPTPLPDATVGVPYSQAITIGVPGHASGFPVIWLQYNAMTNIVTGNTWTAVNDAGGSTFAQWSPLTWQCMTLTGTPTVVGVDSISIYVNASVNIGIPYTVNNTKAFTLALNVVTGVGIQDNSTLTTKLIESHPNPYQDYTRIGLSTGKTEKVTLNVYSGIGQLVYSEVKTTVPGENYFDFTGATLSNGTYLYTVITSDKTFNKKLLKTE